jgi:predicted amidophosphoribosyltransferase
MLPLLWREALALISTPRCPACGGVAAEPPAARAVELCADCQQSLRLPEGGLQGDAPLLWCALGAYGSGLRRVLLRQRPRPQPALINALAAQLHSLCATALHGTLLVPIPSWKRASNPLPRLLAAGLEHSAGGRCRLAEALLQRTRATVGQHHLNRRQRLANQLGSFVAAPPPTPGPMAGPSRCDAGSLWLVDDILTTGATAVAAATALQQAGWRVEGLICLARTPGAATAVI